MVEKEIEIESSGSRLAGTLCLPKDGDRFPVVLMVHGSGPLDRNENIKGQKLNVFNAIAHHLANEGIASLRYDKRGCGKSSGDYYSAGHFDFVKDATACFDALAQSEFCMENEIYVLGHSEGSIVAPQLSLRRPNIAGIILLCPFATDIESLIIKQSRDFRECIDDLQGIKGIVTRALLKLTGDPVASQRKLLEKLKSSNTPAIRHRLRKFPAKWMRELLQIKPREIFGHVKCPMLIIGGEKDIQCDPADVARIAELAKGVVDAHVIRDLTHVLRFDSHKPSLYSYEKLIKKPVETVVLELISRWLKQSRAHRSDS